MKKSYNILLFLLLTSLPITSFSQCFEEWVDGYVCSNIDIVFQTSDTGFFVQNIYDYENVIYYRSIDSGKNWTEIDTSYIFTDVFMEYEHNRGITCGKSGENAAVEIFTNNIEERQMFLLSGIDEILQVSIVSTDTIVFLAKNTEMITCLGKMAITNEIPAIISLIQFEEDNLSQIYFDNQNTGWLIIDGDLHYTQDFGQTSVEKVSDTYRCSFYDENNFMYSSAAGLFCTQDGGDNCTFVTSNFPQGDFIINFAPGLAWCAETWDGTSGTTIFFLLDANNLGENPINTYTSINYGSPDCFMPYAFNEQQLYFSNTRGVILYTLNNCEYFSTEENVVSLNQVGSVFPNPATDQITITPVSFDKSQEIEIKIYNCFGETVFIEKTFPSEELSLDISKLKKGFYIISIANKSEKHLNRFVKI